ncbi:TlpA family protein disulfide reductase [Pseudocnuella soli]|uniref:TlpA family protein disulfide reductase n=1 Tax=Pseudocnuella soli TaxID=2502779 RepID=UPI00104BDE62|nr:redoxin domain-containing protein [Pseudocnuella soli]
MMRLTFLVMAMFVLCGVGAAQKGGNDIPMFKLWRTNGQLITAKELPAKKPVVLIYFAPDCHHCTDLLKGVFKEMPAFKKATLVLATFKPANELRSFEQTYKTASYPNIITGTEGNTFFLRYHYNMQRTPFVALFNAAGKLVRTFDKEPMVKDLLPAVKAL